MAGTQVVGIRLPVRALADLDRYVLQEGILGGRGEAGRALLMASLEAWAANHPAPQEASPEAETVDAGDQAPAPEEPPQELPQSQDAPAPVDAPQARGKFRTRAERAILTADELAEKERDWRLYDREWGLADKFELAARHFDNPAFGGQLVDFLTKIETETGHQRGTAEHAAEAERRIERLIPQWDAAEAEAA
jgi:hypothetical protein